MWSVIEESLAARAVKRRGCRVLRQIAAPAALLLASGCASVLDEDGALTVVPYRMSDAGQIVVDTLINDEGPFTFAFDTGASISVMFDGVRETIGLECAADRVVTIQGLVGSGTFPIAIIDRLQVGGETWAGARLASMPGDELAGLGIDGILGLDFLSRYAVSFSSADSALRLYAPESVRERSYRGWAAVPLREISVGGRGSTVYVINVDIGSVRVPALLDLGASSNIMNWRAARALRIRPLRRPEPGSIAGAVESAPVAAQVEIRSLQTGNLRWSRKEFVIADFPIFRVLGLDDRPMAIVGTGLFNRRDFVIDFARNRLLVRSLD